MATRYHELGIPDVHPRQPRQTQIFLTSQAPETFGAATSCHDPAGVPRSAKAHIAATRSKTQGVFKGEKFSTQLVLMTKSGIWKMGTGIAWPTCWSQQNTAYNVHSTGCKCWNCLARRSVSLPWVSTVFCPLENITVPCTKPLRTVFSSPPIQHYQLEQTNETASFQLRLKSII